MIRHAESADLPRIWELIIELAEFEKLAHQVTGTVTMLDVALFGPEPSCKCLVTEIEGQIVGYVLYYVTFSTFRVLPGIWLEDLYVSPESRGTGLGRAMIDALLNEAKSKGYGRVEWSVLDWNTSAIGFYENLGATVLPDWKICRVSL